MPALLARAKEFGLAGLALTRLATLGTGLAANVFVIAILARQDGPETYAAYALIASLVNLLPFADLGLGASVVNAVSDRTSGSITDKDCIRLVSRARDYMLVVTLMLLPIIAWALSSDYLGLMLGALESVEGVSLGAAYTLICISIAIPLGVGARALQGAGKMIDVVRLGFLGPIVQLAIYVPLFLFHMPAYLYFFGPGTAYLAMALVGYMAAKRKANLCTDWPLITLFRPGSPIQSPWHTALPFLVISLGMALGFQSHRILLTQFSGSREVAEYSIAAQFLGPLIAITAVVGQNLWSLYRGQMHRGELDFASFKAHIVLFGVVGTILAIGFVLFMPIASTLLTGGSVTTPTALLVGAGAYLLTYALHQPSAMLLTDPRALWYQAAFVLAVAVVTVITTVYLVPLVGSAAPYTSMAAAMMVLQVLPSMKIASSRIKKQFEA